MKRNRFFKLSFLLCSILFAMFLCTAPVSAKVKLNKTSHVMKKGATYQLKVKGTKKKVKWKSSKSSVVSVTKKGKIRAKKVGKATITAKVGGKKYRCKVTVLNKNAYNAYKLRNYILNKGKKSGSDYYIELKKTDEEQTEYRTRIETNKKSNVLYFYYSYVPDTATGAFNSSFSLNFIQKSNGSFNVKWIDTADDTGYESSGNILCSYNGSTGGITLTEYIVYDTDENGDVVGNGITGDQLKGKTAEVSGTLKGTFSNYDALMKKHKLGITMKGLFGSLK